MHDLFARIPELAPLYREQFSYLDGEELPHVVFGAFLIPVMESDLENHNTERVKSICAFLEDVAESATTNPDLEQLLRVEIGEWLAGTPWEVEVAQNLGEKTKQVCRYVPGLAAQRISLREEEARRRH